MIRQPSALAVALDAELLARSRESHVAEHHLAGLLVRMEQGRLHRELGFASLVDYAVERLGLGRTAARALLRIGRRLAELPALDQAMARGEISWTKAREVVRASTPESDAAWVELARTTTNRALEHAVRASTGGPPPSLDGLPQPIRMTFTFSEAEAETVRATMVWFRAMCGPGGEDLDEGAILAMLLQRLLADADPETAPTPDRSRFTVVRPGDEAEERALGEAACDAEVVAMEPGPERGHVSRTIPPATRRAVLHRDRRRCQVPGCSNRLWLDLHHVAPRAGGGPNRERNLVSVCCAHHDLIHKARLAVEIDGMGFRFVFPNGRALTTRGRPPTDTASPHRSPPGRGLIAIQVVDLSHERVSDRQRQHRRRRPRPQRSLAQARSADRPGVSTPGASSSGRSRHGALHCRLES